MTRRFLTVVVIAAVALVADISLATAEDGPPETIANAQTAIEALPYDFTFTSPPRDTRKALIIRTIDKLGRSFRFFLFEGRAPLNIGVPSYHREHLGGGALGRSYVMLEDETTRPGPKASSTRGIRSRATPRSLLLRNKISQDRVCG